jgi:hypothetical protein
MAIALGQPGVDGLREAVGVLREWQDDGAPMQLHPGGPGLVLAVRCQRDGRGVLAEGQVCVEAPMGALIQDLLFEGGWNTDEPRTPLRRDLTEPVPDPGMRIEVIGPPPPEQMVYRTAHALADRLGTQPVQFPGGHGGFASHPDGFAARLREVLAASA